MSQKAFSPPPKDMETAELRGSVRRHRAPEELPRWVWREEYEALWKDYTESQKTIKTLKSDVVFLEGERNETQLMMEQARTRNLLLHQAATEFAQGQDDVDNVINRLKRPQPSKRKTSFELSNQRRPPAPPASEHSIPKLGVSEGIQNTNTAKEPSFIPISYYITDDDAFTNRSRAFKASQGIQGFPNSISQNQFGGLSSNLNAPDMSWATRSSATRGPARSDPDVSIPAGGSAVAPSVLHDFTSQIDFGASDSGSDPGSDSGSDSGLDLSTQSNTARAHRTVFYSSITRQPESSRQRKKRESEEEKRKVEGEETIKMIAANRAQRAAEVAAAEDKKHADARAASERKLQESKRQSKMWIRTKQRRRHPRSLMP